MVPPSSPILLHPFEDQMKWWYLWNLWNCWNPFYKGIFCCYSSLSLFMCDLQRIFTFSISLFVTLLWNRWSHCHFTEEGTKAEKRWSASATSTGGWRKPDLFPLSSTARRMRLRVPQGMSWSSGEAYGVSPGERQGVEIQTLLTAGRFSVCVCLNSGHIFHFITMQGLGTESFIK